MANTTNYNWETPDDTDLVKDGAAAIRTLGSSIDTTTKNLNPETTTGDIAYRSATANTNTRLAIGTTGQVLTVAAGVPSWATPTTGDIEGVTAGTGISGGGTSGTVTITNSMATAIDAKGDLVVGTGADTFARLAVGTNGHTLVADSAEATGLKWATASSGGMTLINSGGTTLTGSSVTISSIPATYESLILKVYQYSGATDGTTIRMRFNGDSGANRYRSIDSNNSPGNFAFTATSGDIGANQDDSATSTYFANVEIPNYASTTTWKMANVTAIGNWYTSATEIAYSNTMVVYNQTGAITSIDLFPNSGNFDNGTAYLYGVK